MVRHNLGIAILLCSLVAAIAVRPAAQDSAIEAAPELPPNATQAVSTFWLDDAERQAATLAAAFPIVTCNEGPGSMAQREARVGSFVCGYPDELATRARRLRTGSIKIDTETLEEFQRLLDFDHVAVPDGPPAERDGGFYCGYPPELVFGFHVPARIDAGLRWCFDCGAWQPCACPRSVIAPSLDNLIDDFYRLRTTPLEDVKGALRAIAGEFHDAMNGLAALQRRAAAKVEAAHPDLFSRPGRVPVKRSAQLPDPRPMIKSAFGILIPDSVTWPTIERYFAKPLPGSALPDQRPSITQDSP